MRASTCSSKEPASTMTNEPTRSGTRWTSHESSTAAAWRSRTRVPVFRRRTTADAERAQAPVKESVVDRHHGEGRREIGLRDLRESVLRVEAVCRQELRGGSEEDVAHRPAARVFEQRVEESLRGSRACAAELRLHEHLPQRALTASDVEQRDRADHASV